MTAKVLKQDIRIHEVPIRYRARSHREGKKITWTDAVDAVYALLKYWWKSSKAPVTSVPSDREEATCSLCGLMNADLLFKKRGFPVWRCRTCATQFVSPRLKFPDLMDLYSQENYFKSENSLEHGYTDYVADRENIVATFEKRMNWVESIIGSCSSKRFLDIGCAAGFGVEVAQAHGMDAYGLEPSRYAAQMGRERLGEKIIHGTLDQNPFPSKTFDLIQLWDVIEHVPDPLHTLRQANALTAENGWVSLITPDCGSLVARGMGQHWMEYAKPDEHIHFFSRRTISEALKRTGFEAMHFTTAGKYVDAYFLADRLSGHFPFLKFLKKQAQAHPQWRVYINPGDKLFVLARKIKNI